MRRMQGTTVAILALLAATGAASPENARAASPSHEPTTISAARLSGISLTEQQAVQAGLSLDAPTTLRLPTGGFVVVTPTAPARDADPFHVKRRWFGITAFFNRTETGRIALGYAACALVVGAVPLIGNVIRVYCGLVSAYAAYLRSTNRCLRATVIWGSVAPYWSGYRGRYCR